MLVSAIDKPAQQGQFAPQVRNILTKGLIFSQNCPIGGILVPDSAKQTDDRPQSIYDRLGNNSVARDWISQPRIGVSLGSSHRPNPSRYHRRNGRTPQAGQQGIPAAERGPRS